MFDFATEYFYHSDDRVHFFDSFDNLSDYLLILVYISTMLTLCINIYIYISIDI